MRYYQLTIADPDGTVYQVDKGGLGFAKSVASEGATFSSVWTPWQTTDSQRIGQPNPNALNIYFDLPVFPLHAPQGKTLIRIWGLGLRCIGQAANFNPVGDSFKTFTLRAGMSKGLPLANPLQAGIVAQGQIYQAFGNWAGTEQTLDLIVEAGGNPDVPISWYWPKGTGLQSALKQMFAQAFPTYRPIINTADLIAPSDQGGCYRNVNAFAKMLNRYTQRLGAQLYGKEYPGVSLFAVGQSMYALDGAGPRRPKTIALALRDFVGQPTWIASNQLTFQMALRGDINVGDHVTFPNEILLPYAITTPDAANPNVPASSSSTFRGTFVVNEVHCYANFRQPDAASWNTTFVAASVPQLTNFEDTPNFGVGRLA